MNLPCEVIRDLLPLYAEQMTGEETSALVRQHLEGCPDCREALEKMEKPERAPAEDVQPMKKLKKALRVRRLRAAALAALAVFLALFTVFSHITAKQYLPYSEDLITVEGVGPGKGGQGDALFLSYDPSVSGLQYELAEDPDTGERTLLIMCYRIAGRGAGPRRSDPDDRTYSEIATVPDRVIYGFGDGQKLLYGEPMNGGIEVLPRLSLGYYLLMSLALAAAMGTAALLLRGKKADAVLGRLSLLPLSWAAGHLLVKGPVTLSFDFTRDFIVIAITAAAVYALLLLLWQSLRQWERDRG